MLLLRQSVPGVFSGTNLNANYSSIENGFLDFGQAGAGGFVISGLTLSAGTGLTVNVTTGVALLGGDFQVTSPFTISGLGDNTVCHLYMLNDGSGQSNTTAIQPANSTKLGTATTAGGAVSSVAMGLNSGRQQWVMPQALIPGGPAAGITSAGHLASINLADWNASAGEGIAVYGTLPAGAVPPIPPSTHPVVSKSANYTLAYTDFYVLADATAGAFTLTLPTAAGHDAQEWEIKRVSTNANVVHVATTGGQTIDGFASPYDLNSPMLAIHLLAFGGAWYLV